MSYRKINKYFLGKKTKDGENVLLKRCFGYYDAFDFDPYLLLDFFDSKNKEEYIGGFPWHPHRGIETITYLISGHMEHEDSLRNKGSIKSGECQWMNSGTGIYHKEMIKPTNHLFGTQLWLKIPQEKENEDPSYFKITKDNIETTTDQGVKINILAGTYKEYTGPIKKDIVDPLYLDILIPENTTFEIDVNENYNYFTFVLNGEVNFNTNHERYIESGSGVLYERKGDKIKLNTWDYPSRILLIGGKPLDQNVFWKGPIVTSLQNDLYKAFLDLKNNTFVKHK